MSAETEHQLIRDRCEMVLRQNWREGALDGTPFAYTCPSPGHYPWQWYWDSCFHAIVWRRIDPDRARRELATLLAAQRDDGFIGHTIFWDTPLSGPRRHTYSVLEVGDPMTASIQPPLLGWAWRIAVGDPAQEPGIGRQLDWLARNRDLEGDGLLWIVSPDESGLDASPQFDPIWGRRAHGLPGYVALVHRNRRRRYDARRIRDEGGPVCCEVTTNVLHNLSLLACGRRSLTGALIERCWDESRGLFLPDARPAPQRSTLPATIAALTPLALPDLPVEIGRRLAEEHLLDPRRFWTPVAPSSVSVGEPGFSVRDRGALGLRPRRYWRGPTWVNAAWLCWLGLVRLGYEQAAAELARRLAFAVGRSGLREYYQPYTGAGMGARDFGWSTLTLELVDPASGFSAVSSAGPGTEAADPGTASDDDVGATLS
ncbi:MAG: MGH1-like glycoside hydrolase domain-containing protein [Solirubrobacteraceae bacterium]